MSPQVFTAALFLIHLYLEPVSEVPALAQTIHESVFSIEDVLTALSLLVQTVKLESPDRIQINPSDSIDTSAFSQRLIQLWSDIELGGNSLFMRLKNGIVLGVRGVQLLEFWLNNHIPLSPTFSRSCLASRPSSDPPSMYRLHVFGFVDSAV